MVIDKSVWPGKIRIPWGNWREGCFSRLVVHIHVGRDSDDGKVSCSWHKGGLSKDTDTKGFVFWFISEIPVTIRAKAIQTGGPDFHVHLPCEQQEHKHLTIISASQDVHQQEAWRRARTWTGHAALGMWVSWAVMRGQAQTHLPWGKFYRLLLNRKWKLEIEPYICSFKHPSAKVGSFGVAFTKALPNFILILGILTNEALFFPLKHLHFTHQGHSLRNCIGTSFNIAKPQKLNTFILKLLFFLDIGT